VSTDEGAETGKVVARLLLELLKGRALSLQDVQDATGRSYQTARRYLTALEDVTDLEAEHRGESKVWYLPRRSVAVHPDIYVEETGQLPLFGEENEGGADGNDQ